MFEKETTYEINNHDEAAMKSTRDKLETRIAKAHITQLELISSLQSLVPDLIPSLSLSLQVSSLFNRTRLLKELPESMQMESVHVVGQFPRPDMWMGPPPHGPMRGGGPRMMRGNMLPRPPRPMAVVGGQSVGSVKPRTEEEDLKDVVELLNKKTCLQKQKSKTGEELLDLIRRPTAKAIAGAAKFKSKGGSQVKEYCTALTKEDCRRQTGSYIACEKGEKKVYVSSLQEV